ncbi:MAG TPA: hypothetical protein VJ208_00010 [Candidatus Nanoarchaeia archaeon]|nr:hypothetical protein [Candidatus Nanoarchaeia archaeon]
MKIVEKELTRRSFLEKSLRTAGGIILFGGASSLLNSCGVDENKHYRFDLSRLSDWQAELFLKAGKDYWGVNDGRDDSSRNKVYFGNVSEGKIATTYLAWMTRDSILKNSEKIYTFTVVFKHDINWVNCDIPESYGWDFYNVSAHEWGHIVNLKGEGMHSNDPENIMYHDTPQRC